jgi:segregation and condensation protein B
MEELETQPEDTPEPEPVEETAHAQQTVSIEEWMASSEPSEEEAPQPAPLEDVQLLAVLEACVYVAEEPLMPEQIAAALDQDPERIRALLQQLMAEFEKPEHGVSIKEVAGGYKMATKAEHHEAVRSFVKSLKTPLKLSLPALETLAVVAYKQPVTSPEIMEIRGVQGGGVLKTLLDRKLIAEAGRKNVIGKPILYKTTKEFLIQFGLKDLSELPTLKEFEEIRRMSMADSDAPEASTAAQSGAEAAQAESPAPEAEAVAPEVPAAEASADAETTEAPPAESRAPEAEAVAPEVPAAEASATAQSECEAPPAELPAPEAEAAAPEVPAAEVSATAQSECEAPPAESPAPEAEAAAPEVPAAEASTTAQSQAEAPPAESAAPELEAPAPEAESAPPVESQET